jgi:linoleoyl-CoA desaturase
MKKVTFSPSGKFYAILREEVQQYFSTQQISPKGDARLYAKTIILFASWLYLYVQLVFFTPQSIVLGVFLCLLFGFNWALLGFNVCHDACHSSYSNNNTVNSILGYTFNFLGANAFFWKTKHNIVHHTFTNIDGVDADIIQTKLLRLAPSQHKMGIHRFQHLYCLVLYAISYLGWVFMNDFQKYFTKKVHLTDINGFDIKEHLVFWLSKIMYVLIYLVIPILFVPKFTTFLLGYLIASMACGLVLAMVFQLAHVVEITHFVEASPDVRTRIPQEWAVHQMATTANFAPTSNFLNWVTGGLNFQVEHHLFPQISHVHYPDVRKIVQRVAAKYNVPYLEYPTFVGKNNRIYVSKHKKAGDILPCVFTTIYCF